MPFYLPAASPDLGYELASMMNMLRNNVNTRGDLLRQAATLKPNPLGARFDAPSNLDLGSACVFWSDLALFFVDGVTRIEHAAAYVQTLNDPINWNQFGGANPYCLQQALMIYDRYVTVRVLPQANVIVVGHSLGGATATILAKKIQDARTTTSLKCITFGAPRPGPEAFIRTLDMLDLVRWMNREDPVPLVPPRQDQAALAFLLLSNQQAVNWNSYIQPSGGIQLSSDGSAVDRDIPAFDLTTIQSSLVAWMYANTQAQDNAHSMPYYILRLGERRRLYPDNVVTPTGRDTHEPPVENNRPKEIQTKRIEEALRIQAAQEVAARQPLTVPNKYLFRKRKMGNTWVVVWQDQVVAVGPGKQKATRLARAGNTFFARLQRQGLVGVDSFQALIPQYFGAASNPGNGFSPILRRS